MCSVACGLNVFKFFTKCFLLIFVYKAGITAFLVFSSPYVLKHVCLLHKNYFCFIQDAKTAIFPSFRTRIGGVSRVLKLFFFVSAKIQPQNVIVKIVSRNSRRISRHPR